MKRNFFRFCAILLIPLIVILNCSIKTLVAKSGVPPIDIEIQHNPVEEVTAGERVNIEVEIDDESGVLEARVYFKALETKEYNFIILKSQNDDTYSGTLPAPANGVGSFEYLILVISGNKQVVRTQTYTVTVEDDDDAEEAVVKNEKITVYTELHQAPTEVTGFTDNIIIDIVESSAKFGVVAGLYSITEAGSSSSGAVSGGKVTASTGGISKTAVVVGAVAVAVIVGGVAAASSSSSGDDGNSLLKGAYTTDIKVVSTNCGTDSWTDTWTVSGNGSISSPNRRWTVPGSFSGNTLVASGTYRCCWDWNLMWTISSTIVLEFSENGFTGTREMIMTDPSGPNACPTIVKTSNTLVGSKN